MPGALLCCPRDQGNHGTHLAKLRSPIFRGPEPAREPAGRNAVFATPRCDGRVQTTIVRLDDRSSHLTVCTVRRADRGVV